MLGGLGKRVLSIGRDSERSRKQHDDADDGNSSDKRRRSNAPEPQSEILNIVQTVDVVELPTRREGSRLVALPLPGAAVVVASAWREPRPFDAKTAVSSPMVSYPRQWRTRRGRYFKFQLAGLGICGLMRATPEA